MSWLQIAPGISINSNLPIFQSNPVVQQAAATQQQQTVLQEQQAAANAAMQQQLAYNSQRLMEGRARGNAALTSLRILGAGPNRTGARAKVSARNSKKRKKRASASLRLGSQSSQGGGGGLNIAM